MLYILFFLLIVMMLLNYFFGKKDPFSPGVIFNFSFVFSCAWAVIFADNWSLELHSNTFNVLFCGVLSFTVAALATRLVIETVKGKNIHIQKVPALEIKNSIIIMCIVMEIFVIILSAYSLRQITKLSSISEAINAYDQSVKFSDNPLNYPTYINFLRRAVGALGYWFAYEFAAYFAEKRKIKISYFTVFLLSFISQLLSGGRNASINMIIGLFAYFIFFFEKSKKFYKYRIQAKYFVLTLVFAIILLTVFQQIGVSMGRTVITTGINYIAGYCGAQIKNLDTFLQESQHTSAIWGSQTFINWINWLGPKLGWIKKSYRLYLPFRTVNGLQLGNVGTTFMSFYYDFGFAGVIWLTVIMAVIVQWLYENIKRKKITKRPSIAVITYGYIFSSIVFSFFSNKFYEQNFTPTFFRYVLWWIFFNFMFTYDGFGVKKFSAEKTMNNQHGKLEE